MSIFSFIDRKPKCLYCDEILKHGYDNIKLINVSNNADIKITRLHILYCEICGGRYKINKAKDKVFLGVNDSFINHNLIKRRKYNEFIKIRDKKIKKILKKIKL